MKSENEFSLSRFSSHVSRLLMYTNVLNIIDILGTFAFAVSGAFSAMERKLDPFGTLIIAFTTAIGGGTLRDVLVLLLCFYLMP